MASIRARASSTFRNGVLPSRWVYFGPPHGGDLADNHPVDTVLGFLAGAGTRCVAALRNGATPSSSNIAPKPANG